MSANASLRQLTAMYFIHALLHSSNDYIWLFQLQGARGFAASWEKTTGRVLQKRNRRSTRQRNSASCSRLAIGTGAHESNRPTRVISAASRRKMAPAQKARWASIRKQSQQTLVGKTTVAAPAKRTMSASARRKIAAAQKARWAKVRAQEKQAA